MHIRHNYTKACLMADLSCGIESYRYYYARCARSENGGFCESLVDWFQFDFYHGYGPQILETSCSDTGAIASNYCPPTCRALLKYFKSKLGCCITAFPLNYTLRLWNLCSVPLPAKYCEHNGIAINVPTRTQTCNNKEYFNRGHALTCSPSVGQTYIKGRQSVFSNKSSHS